MVIILALRLITRGGSKANLYQHLKLKHPTVHRVERSDLVCSSSERQSNQHHCGYSSLCHTRGRSAQDKSTNTS